MANCLNCNCTVEEGQLYCESCLKEIEKEQKDEDFIDDLLKRAMGTEETTESEATEVTSQYEPLKQSLGAISSLEDPVVDLEEILINDPPSEPKKKENIFKRLFSKSKEPEVIPEEDEEQEKEEQEKEEQAKQEKKLEKEKKKQEKKKRKAEKEKEAKILKEKKKDDKAKRKQAKLEQSKEVQQPLEKISKIKVSIVVIVVTLFGVLFLYETPKYHYQLAVKEAETFYERKEYEQAYKKLLGVSLKEDDKKLFQKLEQVMLVYSPYCSYKNYETMNCREEALHFLLSGYDQYMKHKEKAKKIGVEKDYKYMYNQIIKTLKDKYNITSEQAKKIVLIEDSKEYTKQIVALLAKVD